MKLWLKKIFTRRAREQSLISLSLSQEALLRNLRSFKGAVPVLKSNAYGHGLIPIAHMLEKEQLPFLIIDSYFEAQALRNE